jgi:hypothetical protein
MINRSIPKCKKKRQTWYNLNVQRQITDGVMKVN